MYLEVEEEGSREGRTCIVGNYGNEAKKSGMIKIKGPDRRKWIYPRPCIMTNLQENRILPCNTSESKISRALQMGIQLKIPKL